MLHSEDLSVHADGPADGREVARPVAAKQPSTGLVGSAASSDFHVLEVHGTWSLTIRMRPQLLGVAGVAGESSVFTMHVEGELAPCGSVRRDRGRGDYDRGWHPVYAGEERTVSWTDKARNSMQRARGKAKEIRGRSGGGLGTELHGRGQQMGADIKDAGEQAKDAGHKLRKAGGH